MKKVGIITIFKAGNFGAELQSFALQRAMHNLGYDAEIIDYPFYKNYKFRYTKQAQAKHYVPFLLSVKEKLLILKSFILRKIYFKEYKIWMKKIEDFHRENTRMSSEEYLSVSELYSNNFNYDAYCVGSDQVWNPHNIVDMGPYFLSFAPKDRLKFSYASSFGVSSIDDRSKKVYSDWLNNLDVISVREESGQQLVNNISNRNCSVVCDPTMLLDADEWRKIAKPIDGLPLKYVLVYELHRTPEVAQVANDIATKNNCCVVNICKDVRTTKIENVISISMASPAEFVYLFSQANFVVTNSFHGTVFSVLFKKNFYTILKRGLSNNSRQIGLLEKLSLLDRLVYTDNINLSESDIVWDNVFKALLEIKMNSESYIRNTIDLK